VSEAPLLEILGWESKGLRAPDHEVSFEVQEESVYPVSLLQMPNGTGKTTTLALLRAALSGSAKSWSADEVRKYRKRNSGSEGHFILRARSRGEKWTVNISFDFDAGVATYRCTSGSGRGQNDGFHPPTPLLPLCREDLVEFFIFDGEVAEGLFKGQKTKNARIAIDQFFRLDLLERFQKKIEEYWDNVTSGPGAKQQRGFQRAENNVKRFRDALSKRQNEYDKLKGDTSALNEQMEDLERRFKEALADNERYNQDLGRLKEEEEDLDERHSNTLKQVLSLFSSPVRVSEDFTEKIIRFRDRLDRVKLPESASREFFAELADEDLCICGRSLESDERDHIRKASFKYLGSDNVAFLNSMKSAVTTALEQSDGEPWKPLGKELKELKEIRREKGRNNTALENLKIKFSDGDPDLTGAIKLIKKLQDQISVKRVEMESYEDMGDGTPPKAVDAETLKSLPLLKRGLKHYEDEFAEAQNTKKLLRQREELEKILNRALFVARTSLNESMVQKTNENLKQLMPHNSIRVSGIDKALQLEGQEKGSVGENLSIAYSFLSTLYEQAIARLPLVIDSPAGSLDNRVRSEVARLVPQLTDQFIAFTISSEREHFVEPLEKSVGSDVQYVTLFRRGDPDLDGSIDGVKDVDEKEDGFVVHGKDYFLGFHVENEEEA
jgi:hypothetical protein